MASNNNTNNPNYPSNPHLPSSSFGSTSSIDLNASSEYAPYSYPPPPETESPPKKPFRPPHHRAPSLEFIQAHSRRKSYSSLHTNPPGGSGSSTHYASSTKEEQPAPQIFTKGKTLLGGLIKPPAVRQFLHNGKFYREEEDRTQSHFELFADLVFVGIVHVLGEVAAEEATMFNAAKFVLLFWPPWSIWSDMRSYINVSGTDDIIQRLYILGSSFLLIGYTANAAAVEVESEDDSESFLDLHIPEHSYHALQAGVAFFLVAKGLRLFLYLLYGLYLPRFRATHMIEALFTLISCAIFVPLVFITDPIPVVALIIVGIIFSIVSRYMSAIVIHWLVDLRHKSDAFIPAISISHVIERTTAFVVLITGETLINISYIASEDQIGVSGEFGRSGLGLVIAFLFCWMYFDSDSARVFVHALRRHWFSSVSFTQIHLPLCGGLIIVSAALHNMVSTDEPDPGITWYFSAGMAVVMISLGIIGFLHKSLDRPGSGLAPRWFRISLRLIAAVVFAVLPKFGIESNGGILGLAVGILIFAVLAETIAKIGTEGHRIEHSHHLHMPHLSNLLPHHHHHHQHQNSGNNLNQPENTTLPVPPGHEQGAIVDHVELDAFRTGTKTYRGAELTAYEKGEEDVGGDNSVGVLRATTVRRGQRTAFAAL